MLRNGIRRFDVKLLSDISPLWMSWVMAALLLLILLVTSLRPNMWRAKWRSLLSPMERKYEDENTSVVLNGMSYLFSISTYALLLLYMLGIRDDYSSQLHCSTFLWIALVVLGIDLLRQGLMAVLQYTFRFSFHLPSVIRHHHNLLLIFAVVGFAILLLAPHLSYNALQTLVIIACCSYVGILWWKIITTIGLDIQKSCYTLLYYLHIEIVPIAAMVMISSYIVGA